jgi:hypothetical protein
MGVINLIVCAHDARDAAHRLTAPVSGGRIQRQRGRAACDRAAESGGGPGVVPAGIQARSLRSPRVSCGPGGAAAAAGC